MQWRPQSPGCLWLCLPHLGLGGEQGGSESWCLDKESPGRILLTWTDVVFLQAHWVASCRLLLLLMAAVEMTTQTHISCANGFTVGVFTPSPLPLAPW